MAQPAKNYATFVKGIITEASPLTFPDNASIDERNFILQRDGSRVRRLGMDFETAFVEGSAINNDVFSDLAVGVTEWKGAASNSLTNFAVVQAGDTLYFYSMNDASVSSALKSFTVDLTLHSTGYASQFGSDLVATSVGKGVLFVASPQITPFYLEYIPLTDTIIATAITIEQRDFNGVDDALYTDDRPLTNSAEHNYNLLNQGWTAAHIATYFAAQAVYPANADVWVLGKDSSDVFQPALMDKQAFGNTPAPKGHFILDAFNRERLGLVTETDTGSPSSIAFYAGRVWYAGVESTPSAGPAINGSIWFSQSLTSLELSGNCYQDADPTSENISDLIDTDGGVIDLPEAGTILKLLPLRDSLVVFADNGVWQIHGGGLAFSGTNYQVDKVSTVGATNAGSILAVEAAALYWTDAGIYILEAQTATPILGARSLTEDTIQTLYNEIPSVAKLNTIGKYDTAAKRISWLYNDTAAYTGNTSRHKYNKELVLDAVLQAWSINEISDLASDTPYLAGAVITPAVQVGDIAYEVQVGGVTVQADAVDVEVTLANAARGSISAKYLTVNPQGDGTSKLTFSDYHNTSFMEWEAADSTGITFLSYLNTGYELMGDMSRKKWVPYITCHFKRTETGFVTNALGGLDPENPSGCYLQGQWQWSDSIASGRWGAAQQVYRLNRLYIPTDDTDEFDDGFSVCTTKSKLRGSGTAVSLYFYSETGKDCHILGWALAGFGQRDV
jgi:hypothetical protein